MGVLPWLPMLLLPARGSVMDVVTTGVACFSLCWTLVDWVRVATLIAVGEGG